MTIGIIGRKVGMTRIFTDDGASVPVTVIECTPNRVAQVKTVENDGYSAVQVAVGEAKASHLNKPTIGHYRKVGVPAGHSLREFRLQESDGETLETGATIGVDRFSEIHVVDVTGISRGKGFAGVQKRWGFGGGRASHGTSLSHRTPGSIGQNQSPGKVWKGKKMAGHMGDERVTTLNLELVKVDAERNLLLIKGSVPGQTGADVIVRPATKGTRQATVQD